MVGLWRRTQRSARLPFIVSEPEEQKNNPDQVCPIEPNAKSNSCLRICLRVTSVLKYLVLMLIIPPFLNYASLQREGVLLQPQEGELVDIGLGQKLYLNCQGKGHPVVIFDAPTGMSSDVWLLIQKDVSQLTQACVYDRAGLGFSKKMIRNKPAGLDNLWRESTTGRMVDDLHRLVKEAKLKSPFILVGSELGAFNARFYTHVHNLEISDLILMNPIPEEVFLEDTWLQYWYNELLSYHQTLQFFAALGLNRMLLIAGLMQPAVKGENISEDFMRRQKYLLSNPAHLSAVVDEHFFINESSSQIRDILKFKPLSNAITITVITGDYYDEQLPEHLNKVVTHFQQQFILQGYPTAKWIKIKGTDRQMIYRNPKAVAKQLKKLINKRKVE
ncbi:uncharacterized protein si:dkey-122a22.2 isoform X1 [Hemiscyllium ocellatum]|uniref:uncharacterized protein si:dkey-122a22.2 isoform X1 n=1 Tax=Hemiscyllium ocellatum TaxID=170820 RepID=UPI002966EF83|nr:uncharacterized protein si:dkey-122a22.2 isoform X1 [Hemiscyllium ocellatum]